MGKREQGQAKQAINNFEKALGVDPGHRPTLDALIEVYAEIKDWKQVVLYRRQILDNVMDGDERFKMLLEIADIWNDNDKAPLKAIEALEEAKDIKPEDRPLLHKMLALYEQIRARGRTAAAALNVSSVPSSTVATQLLGQSMAAGLDVTVPPPFPAKTIVTM